MNKEELKQIILKNLQDADKIIKENKEILSFLNINDIMKNLKYSDLRISESPFHKRTTYKYHIAYLRKDNLRKRFKIVCGNIEFIDKNTIEGQNEIVSNVKKRWVKYVRRVYPEYIDLVQ